MNILNKPIPVQMNCFVDCGYDPSYTPDGNFYIGATYHIEEKIRRCAITIIYRLQSFFNPNHKTRKLYKALVNVIQAEKTWHKTSQKMASPKGRYGHYVGKMRACEHDFYEALSKLYKKIVEEESLPKRLFPSEVIQPNHVLLKNQQNNLDYKKFDSDSREIKDLTGLSHCGYDRLSSACAKDAKDRFSEFYVSHRKFGKATENARNQFKDMVRVLRKRIRDLPDNIYYTVSPNDLNNYCHFFLGEFKNVWDQLINSHELYKDSCELFSKKDHYKKQYSYEKKALKTYKHVYEDSKIVDQDMCKLDSKLGELRRMMKRS